MSDMNRYCWVKTIGGKIELRNHCFRPLNFPKVEDSNNQLKKKLEDNGFTVEPDIIEVGDTDFAEWMEPINSKTRLVKAVLMKEQEDGSYIPNGIYEAETTDPDEYSRARKVLEKCQQEIKEEHKQLFEEMFRMNSLDGKTSDIKLTSIIKATNGYVIEDYIPREYIKICDIFVDWDDWHYRGDHHSIFMKKFDAEGEKVVITINDEYMGDVIGKNGKNIKKIANLINAKYIEVISKSQTLKKRR
jgi:predicted RNA-binding protein YlqC (UPF0109 family)